MATWKSYFTWNSNKDPENADQCGTLFTRGVVLSEAAPPQHETDREETSH
jgi:hypothetical protein